MADPVLDAHRVLPGLFVISTPVRPISIRDQMVRARLLVDRLVQHGALEPVPARPLLVVGAGAGGVTAAIRAAERGWPTWLVDEAPMAFGLQAASTTRWLDPAQYDWPAEHWQQGYYPWDLPPMPLTYPAAWSRDLALHWSLELAAARRRLPLLRVDFNLRVQRIVPPASTGALHVQLGSAYVGWPFPLQPVAGIVWAAGFGTEQCRIIRGGAPVYEGRRFWSSDPLALPGCGLSPIGSTPTVPTVLIAGAGDGGLQDWLRAITKLRSARAIYELLQPSRGIERRLQTAEEQAHRSLLWQHPQDRRYQHAVQAALQDAHLAAVDIAITERPVLAGLSRLFRQPPDDVRLVYRCTHFTNQYGLNRFLVLLIARYLKAEYGRDLLLPERGLVDVRSLDGHVCLAGPPGHCDGRDHEVELETYPRCFAGAIGPAGTIRAGLIVVRYGLDTRAATVPLPPARQHLSRLSRPDHSLPYHVPRS